MSTLGSITDHLEREQELLRTLNTALINLEAQALNRAAELGVEEHQLETSRAVLLDFIRRLLATLRSHAPDPEVEPLVKHMKGAMKPLQDWEEDLNQLVAAIENQQQLPDALSPVLEDLLTMLDNEFTQDLRRLYSR